ncbi:ribonuclease III [Thermotoga profunda]|uniref:ribonuclease III n=1 Tax=Thermotoga profunda TaxID=1508420 RepID=UPI0005974461|nr:ribonuclease III [Thermotoga profunda]
MNKEEISTVISFMESIGYRFLQPQLIYNALCHSSYAHEQNQRGRKDVESNERLEFLGDAAIDLLIAEYLYTNLPDASEGIMAKVKAAVASEEALAQIARDINLGQYLFLGHGEEVTGGRDRDSILADTLEAVAAAIYIDGGMSSLKRCLLSYFAKYAHQVVEGKIVFDYKTFLQEITQDRFKQLPEYVVVDEQGPSHMKRFTVELRLNRKVIAVGEGFSIKEAEKNAAKKAIEKLKGEQNQ